MQNCTKCNAPNVCPACGFHGGVEHGAGETCPLCGNRELGGD